MLGHDLAEAFRDLRPTLWDVGDCDITDFVSTEERIRALAPMLIINAAAYTAVDKAESEEVLATRINGDAVGNLARVARAIKATIIHYSTDYVFNGENTKGYSEDDLLDPVNAYGRSKAEGERQLQAQAEWFYLIRTSWLYGKHGKNFVDTMLKLARERNTISVVNDQRGKPTWTKDLAKQTRFIVDHVSTYSSGIYHVTNEQETTWNEFAKAIFELAGVSVTVQPIPSQEYPTPAKRPAYSSLINTKLPTMRPWKDALAEYLSSIESQGV